MKQYFKKQLLAAFMLCFSLFAQAQAQQQSKDLYLSYEERVIASYILLAAGESVEVQNAAAERAVNYAQKVQQIGTKRVKVQTFNEFLQLFRGEWPNAHSVEANLEILENTGVRPFHIITSDDPATQAQIEEFHQRRNIEITNRLGNMRPLFNSYKTLLLAGGAATAGLAQDLQQRFSEQSGELIRGEFKKVASIGKELLERQGPRAQTDAFNTFISFAIAEYFQNLGLNSQKQIISQILGEDLAADPIRKFEIMVLNSGPQFQKLLQVVAREATIPDDMLQIFKRLESLTMPVPQYFVEKIMQNESKNFEILEFEMKPLGIGTMAQVHRGTIKTEKGERKVVIRFIKPGMESRVHEDHEILLMLAPILDAKPALQNAGFAKIAPLAEELTQTVMDELDIKGTIERQKLGRMAYNRTIHLSSLNREMMIRVPQIYDAQTNDSKLMVQELVKGMKLDRLQERHKQDMPELKKEVTVKLAEVWLSVLLFESGFYHSDLHQGNILVDMGSRILPFNLLDFGMAGKLTEKERQYFLMMAAGGELNNGKMLAEAMYGISSPTRNEIDQVTFQKLIEDKMFVLKSKNQVYSPDRWIAWALNMGLRFSSEIIGVSRGFTILDKVLKDANSGTSVLGISRSLAKKHKWEVLSTLRSSPNFRSLDYLLMGRQALFGGKEVDRAPFEHPPVLAPMCRSVILAH